MVTAVGSRIALGGPWFIEGGVCAASTMRGGSAARRQRSAHVSGRRTVVVEGRDGQRAEAIAVCEGFVILHHSPPLVLEGVSVNGTRLLQSAALGSDKKVFSSRQSAVNSWQSAVGSQQSAVGSQQSAVGSRQSAVGSWQSAVGSPQSAVGSRQSAVGRR